MATTTDLASYLQTHSIGTVGTDIFIETMPASPDDCVSIFQYEGRPPDLVWNGEYPGVQVRVRGAPSHHDEAFAKAHNILKHLHLLVNQTINSHVYHLVEANGSVWSAGRDVKGRWLYTINFSVVKEME